MTFDIKVVDSFAVGFAVGVGGLAAAAGGSGDDDGLPAHASAPVSVVDSLVVKDTRLAIGSGASGGHDDGLAASIKEFLLDTGFRAL